MAPCRKHQKAKKQDTDGLPHQNNCMTTAPNIILVTSNVWTFDPLLTPERLGSSMIAKNPL